MGPPGGPPGGKKGAASIATTLVFAVVSTQERMACNDTSNGRFVSSREQIAVCCSAVKPSSIENAERDGLLMLLLLLPQLMLREPRASVPGEVLLTLVLLSLLLPSDAAVSTAAASAAGADAAIEGEAGSPVVASVVGLLDV